MSDRFTLLLKNSILAAPLLLFVVVIVYLFSPHASSLKKYPFFAPKSDTGQSDATADVSGQPKLTPEQERINTKVDQGALPTREEFNAAMADINASVSGDKK